MRAEIPVGRDRTQFEQTAIGAAKEALESIIAIEKNCEVTTTSFDALFDITWRGKRQRYACEIKNASTPRILSGAIAQSVFYAQRTSRRPLVLVPYLAEDKLRMLAEQEVSGIDMCGNAYLIADDFTLWRSGFPNRFKEPAPNLNPFRGDKSVFARCFLLQTEFGSLSELHDFAANRLLQVGREMEQGALRLGTASKTIQALEEQLIVQRTKGSLRLLDRQKLLTQLKRHYASPVTRRVVGKMPYGHASAWELLTQASEINRIRFAATGIYSASHEGVLSPSERLMVYVDNVDTAISVLDFKEAKAFVNCELIETKKIFPYFDVWREDGVPWASSLQTWLELATGTSRELHAALDLEKLLFP